MERAVRQVRPNDAKIVHDVIDGQVLVIHSETGAYYSLEGTAAWVWVAMLRGLDEEGIVRELTERYPDAAADIAGDVAAFLDQLLAQTLVVPGAPTPEAEVPPISVGAAWTAPALEVFTDMQDLLLFDPIHEVGPEGWPYAADDRG
jgi:hypothetical protein